MTTNQLLTLRATPSAALAPFAVLPAESDHTTHFSTIDAAGNAVALTYTLEDRYGASNSRPLECDSSWFAHFDSEIMIRHLPRAEMMAKSGLPEPESAPIRQSGTGLGS